MKQMSIDSTILGGCWRVKVGRFEPFFLEHGPKNWLEMCRVNLRANIFEFSEGSVTTISGSPLKIPMFWLLVHFLATPIGGQTV